MFLNNLFDYKSLVESCEDTDDEEAVEEVSIFLGISWNHVTFDMVHLHPSVWSFFTPLAFRYYTPALINCCNHDIDKSRLAFENFISYFDPVGGKATLQRRKSVVIGYLIEELLVIDSFFDNIKSELYDQHMLFSLAVARSIIANRDWLKWSC